MQFVVKMTFFLITALIFFTLSLKIKCEIASTLAKASFILLLGHHKRPSSLNAICHFLLARFRLPLLERFYFLFCLFQFALGLLLIFVLIVILDT